MPVTAKLSKEFYEKFGHAAVDELVNWLNQMDTTYTLELRELNESNFARFDAKLEQRIAELRSDVEARLARIDAKLEQRVAQLEAKMDVRFAEFRTEFLTAVARLEGGLIARIALAESRQTRVYLATWIATLGALAALLKL